jgi:predicted LPLAT superfamily acyltransferase
MVTTKTYVSLLSQYNAKNEKYVRKYFSWFNFYIIW